MLDTRKYIYLYRTKTRSPKIKIIDKNTIIKL